MAHTEYEIRRIAKQLLDKYGQLNTSELENLIFDIGIPDKDDLRKSKTRNGEPMLRQIIRNVVVHQTEKIQQYPEGFIIDKTKKPAIWNDAFGKDDLKQFDTNIIKARREEYKNKLKKGGFKINWDEKNKVNNAVGIAGEDFVMQEQIDYVNSISTNLISRVIHSSLTDDSLGYDILSIDDMGMPLYIEVKTTTGDLKTAFYMSKKEKDFLCNNPRVFLFRVYDFNINNKHGLIKKYRGEDLDKTFNFDASTFIVSFK